MSALGLAVRDSGTMLRRNLKHAIRYPGATLGTLLVPIILLLMFVFLFGGTMAAGFGGSPRDYANYVVPGIIVLAITSGSVSTAVGVNMDMTEGIVDRFRTMAIAQSSVLTGHVVGGTLVTTAGALLVAAVGALVGFRPIAGLLDWLAVIGMIAVAAFAITWISVALGLQARNPESASNIVLPVALLPILGGVFVRPESMPSGIRWFAQYQPFTP